MPFHFPTLRFPTISVPSFAEFKASVVAFKGRVASALKSLGHREPSAPKPLAQRTVDPKNPPEQRPFRQLRKAVAEHDAKVLQSKLQTEVERRDEDNAYYQRIGEMKNHVRRGDIRQSDPLGSVSVDVIKGRAKDQHALKPGAIPKSTTPAQPMGEPELASIGPIIAKWDHPEVFALARKLSDNLDRIETLKQRIASQSPDDPKKPFTLGGPGSGAAREIADIEKENRAISASLGVKIGQAFKTLPQEEQEKLATGSGGALKEQFWNLLRTAAPGLPEWKFRGEDFDHPNGNDTEDVSTPKQLLDHLYHTAASQLDNHLNPGPIPHPTLQLGDKTYQFVKTVGAGGGGAAHLYVNEQGHRVILKEPFIENRMDPPANLVKEARAEVRNHDALKGPDGKGHPNILKKIAVVQSPQGYPMPVLEFASGGDLTRLIGHVTGKKSGPEGTHPDHGLLAQAVQQRLVSPQAAHLVKLAMLQQSIVGMVYLQEKLNVRVADFKPGNMLLDSQANLKIADFGSMSLQSSGPQPQLEKGTPPYQPPEVFLNEVQGNGTLTAKADTWAIGAFAHQLFLREFPLDPNGNRWDQREALMRYGQSLQGSDGRAFLTKLGEDYDKTVMVQGVTSLDRFLNAMMHPDPDKRPTLSQVLNSSLFDDLGRFGNDLTPEVLELAAALLANPQVPALIKQKSDALGV